MSGRGRGLGCGDEGVRLDLHPVGGELDLAVHRVLSLAGVGAAGDRAAEPLRPLSERAETVRGVTELKADLLPAVGDAEVRRLGQVFHQQTNGKSRKLSDG